MKQRGKTGETMRMAVGLLYRLEAGEWIGVTQLADRLGVSVVRASVLCSDLQARGYLEKRPRGVRLTMLGRDDAVRNGMTEIAIVDGGVV